MRPKGVIDGKQVNIPAPPSGGYRDGVKQKDKDAGCWYTLSLYEGMELWQIRVPLC